MIAVCLELSGKICNNLTVTTLWLLSMRNPVLRGFDQVRLEPACLATETSKSVDYSKHRYYNI